MGLRRLRNRLDQLQGEANQTMALAQDLISDLQDGFGVTIEMDENAAQALMDVFTGKGRKIPVTIKIDPKIDSK